MLDRREGMLGQLVAQPNLFGFGLTPKDAALKIFRAGLISSSGEMEHVMSGQVPIVPFTVGNVLDRDDAIRGYNHTLFVFDSLEALKAELAAYFDSI